MSLIILEGPQSCGKTTLGKSYVAAHPEAIFLEEWVDEMVLKEYLENMKEKATNFQFYIQEETINRVKKAIELVKSGKTVLLDRGLIGNQCFAKVQHDTGVISDQDFERYLKSFSYELIPGFPEIYSKTIYMKADAEFCLQRIRFRAREGESSYDLNYLNRIIQAHNDLLKNCAIMYIHTNDDLTREGLLSFSTLVKYLQLKF